MRRDATGGPATPGGETSCRQLTWAKGLPLRGVRSLFAEEFLLLVTFLT